MTQFTTLGFPGRWFKAETVGPGTFYATGSQYGVGAITVISGTTGTATFAGGGSISLAALSSGTVYEFSVSEVAVSAGSASLLYPSRFS